MSRGIRIACIDALRHPLRFCLSRPFGASWILYAATYAVSNTSQTLTRNLDKAVSSSITFAATMLVNVPLGIWKDISFAQTYGVSKAATASTTQSVTPCPSKVSRAATLTFLARDGLTIFGSFVLAPAAASSIPDSMANNAHTKTLITQLTVPVISQWFATPLHLLGLDFHNRQQSIHFSGRMHRIKGDLLSSTLMRCLRIIPAFGVGCIANVEARLAFQNIATRITQ
jgi:hypothetical protein